MKKIFYILAGAVLCATACQRETLNEANGLSTTVPPSPGDVAALEFTVDYPDCGPGTRANMGEADFPSTLHIAVFSYKGGYLQNWIPATLVGEVTPPEAGMKVTYKYKAYLPINTNEVFHFIGDSPIEDPTFANEKEFIESLVTENKQGAFWQRVIVEGGVAAKRNTDGSFDYDENGNYKIDLNANGYNATDNPNPLRHVVMIRNFAKIEVQSVDENFSVLQWALVNVPSSGTVAPWSAHETGSVVGFDIPYTEIKDYLPESTGGTGKKKLGTFYDDLTKKDATGYKGYYGTVPPHVNAAELIDQSEPTTFVQANATDAGLYMYERRVPSLSDGQPATMILLQLRWVLPAEQNNPKYADIQKIITAGKGTDQWYMIELLDEEGEFMPILRNIKYKFYLSGLDEAGYQTAHAAFGGNVFGNVSTSLETSTLNEITVGENKIVVQNMDFPFFNENEENTTLEFQYYPSLTGNPVFNTDKTGDDETKYVDISIVLRSVDGYEPAIKSLSHVAGVENPTIVTSLPGVTSTVAHGGVNWGAIPITLNESGDKMLKSIVRVQGRTGNGRVIFRDVMFTVMANPDFTEKTAVSALARDASGQDVTVTIGLPEGLGSSMFPIQVQIEAENNCLSTTSTNLPVEDKLSTFVAGDKFNNEAYNSPQIGKHTFYYIRTINYSEYYHPTQDEPYTYTFNCVFKTTKTSGNAPTKIKISDKQSRFNSVIKELKVGSGS